MAETPPAVRFTVADLELFPDDSQRYEIIDGELFVSRAAHHEHQETGNLCAFALTAWNNETRLGRVIPAAGVNFSEADSVIPDVVWVSRERLARIVDDAGHLQGAPELVVEVLSPGASNERRDREAKLKLYSIQGVHEYWIVDWRAQTVAVYRRHEAQLRLVGTLERGDTLTSPLLPGFELVVAQLFARD
jgi:Uma2 family endonuclease